MNKLKMKYFVLFPYKETPQGAASRVAIDSYAKNIEKYDPELTKELQQWMRDIGTNGEAGDHTPKEIYISLPTHSLSYFTVAIKYYGNIFTYYGDTLWSKMEKFIAEKFLKWEANQSSFSFLILTIEELTFLNSIVSLERKYAQKNRDQWTDVYKAIDNKVLEYCVVENDYE